MSQDITFEELQATQPVAGTLSFTEYIRLLWTAVNAIIAIVAGISTLTLTVAHVGFSNLNDAMTLILYPFARFWD